ncbi:MAG: hypothetical protein ACJAVP_001365 [Spirosomataceae bacterium]|jgi:hypothetical protein
MKKKRIFEVYRPIFISWYEGRSNMLEASNELEYLVHKYCPHLGRETFFDLIPPAWEED